MPQQDHLPNFSLQKAIINGPQSIIANKQGNWLIEIYVTNIGKGRISNVVMANIIHLSHIDQVKLVSVSKGNALFVGNNITWSIGSLRADEKVILSVEITGSFSNIGVQPMGEVNVSGFDTILGTIVEGPLRDIEIHVL